MAHPTAAGPEKDANAPTVAVIGTEGCGKTVLATVFAKRYLYQRDSVSMSPVGVKTLKYMEKAWSILKSGDWPPSTPPGELFDLRWTFTIENKISCELRLLDCPGQDLRYLFEEEAIFKTGNHPRHLQELKDYIVSASIVLFIVNLKDFIGQKNRDRRTSNEAAIKSAVDYFCQYKQPDNLCIVLTESDKYKALADERGGWMNLLVMELPYVFGAHANGSRVKVLPVTAVLDTTQVVDQDGKVRSVPKPAFRSQGFLALAAWLRERIVTHFGYSDKNDHWYVHFATEGVTTDLLSPVEIKAIWTETWEQPPDPNQIFLRKFGQANWTPALNTPGFDFFRAPPGDASAESTVSSTVLVVGLLAIILGVSGISCVVQAFAGRTNPGYPLRSMPAPASATPNYSAPLEQQPLAPVAPNYPVQLEPPPSQPELPAKHPGFTITSDFAYPLSNDEVFGASVAPGTTARVTGIVSNLGVASVVRVSCGVEVDGENVHFSHQDLRVAGHGSREFQFLVHGLPDVKRDRIAYYCSSTPLGDINEN